MILATPTRRVESRGQVNDKYDQALIVTTYGHRYDRIARSMNAVLTLIVTLIDNRNY